MMIFFSVFIFGAEHFSKLLNLTSEQRESLTGCFGNRNEPLLSACLARIEANEMPELFATWKDVIKRYHATSRQTSSQGYEKSAQYELFFVLSCLETGKRRTFLEEFNTFFNKIRRKTETNISASFLMVIYLIECQTPRLFDILKERFVACRSKDPGEFVAQFGTHDHSLQNAYKLMRANDDLPFLIEYTQKR